MDGGATNVGRRIEALAAEEEVFDGLHVGIELGAGGLSAALVCP